MKSRFVSMAKKRVVRNFLAFPAEKTLIMGTGWIFELWSPIWDTLWFYNIYYMIYFRIFDARAGGLGYPAPGGASPRYIFSGPGWIFRPLPRQSGRPTGGGVCQGPTAGPGRPWKKPQHSGQQGAVSIGSTDKSIIWDKKSKAPTAAVCRENYLRK